MWAGIVFVVVISFSSLAIASSEEKSHEQGVGQGAMNAGEKSTVAVGFNAGQVVGNGILLRRYFSSSYVQSTLVGYIDKPNDDSYFNFSASYVKYVKIIKKAAINMPVGLKWVTGVGALYNQYQGASNNRIHIGSGIGIDFGSVNQVGLTYSLNLIYTASFEGLTSPTFVTLAPKPTFGILYNF